MDFIIVLLETILNKMNIKAISIKQKKIENSLKNRIHPDNPLAFEMTKRYRELENLKQLLTIK
tara:strand:- start:792 stop:980 length:189 start_codon:yes stop_codon:yes gene_type:complete